MDRSISEEYDPEEEAEIDDDLSFEVDGGPYVTPSTEISKIKSDFPILDSVLHLSSYFHTTFQGINVYKKNSLFSNMNVSWTQNKQKMTGSNLDRMRTGRAGVGIDNQPVNLHHIYQTPDGPIMELLQSDHKQYYGSLHKNTGQSKSLIDRREFASWRRSYWQNR